jgi:hypothetical protein
VSLTVYVGHSVHEAEKSFLWEFQANAAAHNIKVVLASYEPVASLTASRQAQIRAADAFLAVVTLPAPHVEAEARFAQAQKKPVFVYIWQGIPFNAPSNAVMIRYAQGVTAPTLLADVAEKLKPIADSKKDDTGKAIAAIIAAGAALFLLFSSGKR